jgi:tape measure domain-containing protein
MATNSAKGLRDLDREFANLEAESQAFGTSLDVVSRKKEVLKQKIVELIAQGLKPEDAKVQELRASYDALGREEDELGQKHGNQANDTAMLTTLYGQLSNAAMAMAGALAGVAVKSVTMAAGFETAQVSWGVLLGDMKAGKPMMDSIKKWAAETPYAFDAANKAATTLKGFGVEGKDIIPIMNQLGDVAQGNGDKLGNLALVFGQVKAQGKAMTQDLYQFINAGVPIFDLLSKAMGATTDQIKDLAASGSIRFEDISKAMELATSKGGLFEGMMDKTSKTAAGQWSTALDNVNQALADLGSQALPGISAVLGAVNKSFEGDGAKAWATALGVAVPIVISATVAVGALGASAFLASGAFATLTKTIQAGAMALKANPVGLVLTVIAVALPPVIALMASLGKKTEDTGQKFADASVNAAKFREQIRGLQLNLDPAGYSVARLHQAIIDLSKQNKYVDLTNTKEAAKYFDAAAKSAGITREQFAQLVVGSTEASEALKAAAQKFLPDYKAPVDALTAALAYQDALVAKGLKTESEALAEKVKLRQKEIDKIEEAGAKAGKLTDDQVSGVKAQQDAIKGYQDRIEAIKAASDAEKEAYATQYQLDQEFEDRRKEQEAEQLARDAEFAAMEVTDEQSKISQLLDLYDQYGLDRIDLETLTVDQLVALNEYMASKGEAAWGDLGQQVGAHWKKTLADLTKKSKDWSGTLSTITSALADGVSTGLKAVGAALVNGNSGWAAFGAAGVEAIGKVLEALGAQLAAMAAVELGKQNYGMAAALGAASAAAFVAAGAMGALASNMASVSSSSSAAAESIDSVTSALDDLKSTAVTKIAAVVSGDTAAQIAAKTSAISDQQTKISQLQAAYEKLSNSRPVRGSTSASGYENKISAWEEQLSELQRQISDSRSSIDTLTAEIETLKAAEATAMKAYSDALQEAIDSEESYIGAYKKLYTDQAYYATAIKANLESLTSAEQDFWEGLSSIGTDIAASLIDNLTSGLTESDFDTTIKEYITNLVIQAAVYTDALESQIADIGADIAAGIASGFSQTQIDALKAKLSALYKSASTAAASATAIIDAAFADATDATTEYEDALAAVKSASESFFDSLDDVGTDIASKLIDNLVDGLSGDDFLYAMEEYITEAVIKAAVYTDAFMAEVSAIGAEIAAGISSGFSETDLAALKDRLAALYESAAAAADVATSVVQSAFSSYAVGTLDVAGDQTALIHDSEIVLPAGISEEARSAGIYIGPPEGLTSSTSGQFSTPLSVSMVATGTMVVDGKTLGQVAFENFDTQVSGAYGS